MTKTYYLAVTEETDYEQIIAVFSTRYHEGTSPANARAGKPTARS